ncbi:MAG: DUF6516 family protein [candidate division WOR-3 bacterium]
MAGKLLFYRKNIEAGGDIVEMKIWEVPRSSKDALGLKYSLVYIRGGKRLIGYDNAEGKGHHRHVGRQEHPYAFRDVEVLIQDFLEDVKKVREDI